MTTVKKIYAGATANGRPFAYGFPVGHEGGTSGWAQEPNFRFLALDNDDPAFSWKVLNLDRDLPQLKTMTEILSPRITTCEGRPTRVQAGVDALAGAYGA